MDMNEKAKHEINALVHYAMEKQPWPIKFTLTQITDLVMSEKRKLPQGLTDNEIRSEIEVAWLAQR